VDFKQFLEGEQFTVEKDEKTDSSRLLVAKAGDRVHIAFALWKKGASRYFTCHATLDAEAAPAAPAFEKACQSMTVSSW